ncbi:hypothetical protein KVT40_004068 [Elsinoe batatas]|uniref:Uncharacterized protein n=1 Tax=Elsinoe batatas TaxID=2601811 RepID=A0A8K0L663_9PEZI|nr:hypothetical protein KVT40_004068 [Elsinoe batatas]
MSFLALLAFTTSSLPSPLLRTLDSRLFHGSPRRSRTRLALGLRSLLSSLGGIQLIVALSILLHAYLNLSTISMHHFCTSPCLAWLSLTSTLLSLLDGHDDVVRRLYRNTVKLLLSRVL